MGLTFQRYVYIMEYTDFMEVVWITSVIGSERSTKINACRILVFGFGTVTDIMVSHTFNASKRVVTVLRTMTKSLTGKTLRGTYLLVNFDV